MLGLIRFCLLLLGLGYTTAAVANDRATCLATRENPQNIIAACTRLITSGKVHGRDLAVVYNQRGRAHEDTGAHEKALADLSEAIRIDPKYGFAYNNRSWVYANIGDYDRAIEDASAAIRIDPKHATAYVNRGVGYERKRDYDAAIADYSMAIRVNPKFSAAYNNRGVSHNAKGDYDRAIRDFDEAIKLDPRNPATYFNRGVSYERKNDIARALANYRAVLKLVPHDLAAENAIKQLEQAQSKPGPDLAILTDDARPSTSKPTTTSSPAAYPGPRIALVIGNGAYENTPALLNPANDAEDMAAALQRVGFTVQFERNLDKRGMERAMARFARAAHDSDAALFYYAGHGLQHRGLNYLMPTDAKLEDEYSLSFEMTRLDDVLGSLAQARGVKILVVDACRRNPLVERLLRVATTRDFTGTRGLARLDATRGMVIAYATQADQVADDGTARNSPFTAALVKQIEQPGLEIGALFRRVAAEVNRATGGRQLPELSVSLVGEFYFSRAETDVQAWTKLRGSQNPAELREFITRYPSSPLVADIRERLETIERTEEGRPSTHR